MAEAVRRTADGIGYLAPATGALFSHEGGGGPAQGRQRTCRIVLPTLDADESGYLLSRAIALVRPGHWWLGLPSGEADERDTKGAAHESVDDALPA